MRTLFDVIIPTYNNLGELQECLEGFRYQHETSFVVLVCIDGSTDGTSEWLQSQAYTFPFAIRICEHADKKNHGRNATRNLALEHITSQYICFCDSDCVPRPDMLSAHKNILERNAVISAGNVIYTNTATNAWALYHGSRGRNKYPHMSEIPFYYLATGNAAHRAQYFVELGGQDPAITRYGGGDTEYAIRLYKRYKLPVIFTANSYVDSVMTKNVCTIIDDFVLFGMDNLPYIQKLHPDIHEIFGLPLLQSQKLRHRIFRAMFSLRLARTFSTFVDNYVEIIPAKGLILIIQYIVFSAITHGWKNSDIQRHTAKL